MTNLETHPPSRKRTALPYWPVALGLIGIYLLIWLVNFRYVYGWLMDDRLVYIKACQTVDDILAPFRADLRNALHTYFYLISYIPAALPFSLPSYPLPEFAEQTGHFRFFLLYTVFLHVALLVVWAWFLRKLTSDRIVALLAILFLLTSPSFVLWTPQPDSRFLGLLAGIPALYLLWKCNECPSLNPKRRRLLLFLSGTLVGAALSIHYTALYLLGPVTFCYWLLLAMHQLRQKSYWLGLTSFVLGLLWLHAAFELISRFLAGVPWDQGPTKYMLVAGRFHNSHFEKWQDRILWKEWFSTQMGWALVIAAALGWVIFIFSDRQKRSDFLKLRLAVAVAIPLSLIALFFSGKMAFFRMTTVLQPFIFLFAAAAIVWIARRTRRVPAIALVILLLAALCGLSQWKQSLAVFRGHLGLGKSLTEAHTTGAPVQWLRVAWYADSTSFVGAEDFEHAAPDTRVVSYFPAHFVWGHPDLAPALSDTAPIAREPTLWSTDAIRAEIYAYWPNNNWKQHELMSQARVYRAGDLTARLDRPRLSISSITADSTAGREWEPANVFEGHNAPDQITSWKSADSPAPHWLEIRFAAPALLSELSVVLPKIDEHARTVRVAGLSVDALEETGLSRQVWHGSDLGEQAIINTSWPALSTKGVRLTFHGQTLSPWQSINQCTVEEVVFPEYRVVAPPLQRPFPDLRLTGLGWSDRGITVTASGLTPQTVLVHNGIRMPMRPTSYPDQIESLVPGSFLSGKGQFVAHLSDGIRRSNELSIQLGKATLQAIQPATVQAGDRFSVQPDGSCAISIECQDAAPGIRVMFDNLPLPTVFGSANWLTATLPASHLDQAGVHKIKLRTPCGESNELEFVVRPRIISE